MAGSVQNSAPMTILLRFRLFGHIKHKEDVH